MKENYFPIKKINAKRGAKISNQVKLAAVCWENGSTFFLTLSVKIQNDNNFVELSLNTGVLNSEAILKWQIWAFFALSMILEDLNPDKKILFLLCFYSEKFVQFLHELGLAWYQEFRAKLLEIKVVEINAQPNQWHGN